MSTGRLASHSRVSLPPNSRQATTSLDLLYTIYCNFVNNWSDSFRPEVGTSLPVEAVSELKGTPTDPSRRLSCLLSFYQALADNGLSTFHLNRVPHIQLVYKVPMLDTRRSLRRELINRVLQFVAKSFDHVTHDEEASTVEA